MPDIIKYNEEELVALLKSGDESAFAYLYDNYSAALYGIICRIINNNELAEDILQESFVKIWNNISSYDATKGRLFTWMLNITRNLSIDTTRSKSYKKQTKIQSTENAVNYATNNINENDKFDALGIRKQLTALKVDQKQIIDLAYFEGFTQNEISQKLGIPLGTVKTRMRTAIFELKKLLQF
ncbi:MAG TPA: sigma-70 family RNA polymerase sigma factor [Hanamia sp.]|nr:sigma-70 family RNA polymerase sigma factor [Hanamia sp.]